MKRQRAVHTDTRGRNGAAALWTAPVLFFAVALRCRTKRLRVKDASVSEHQLKGTRDLTTCFFFFFFLATSCESIIISEVKVFIYEHNIVNHNILQLKE